MDDKILRLPDVKAITGLSRSLIYKLVSEGRFPKAHRLSTRAVGWLKSDVAAWLQEKATVAHQQNAS